MVAISQVSFGFLKRYSRLFLVISAILSVIAVQGQSPSFKTFINPVIPGDHPDPTLTRIGDYFYTSGSSFNPTPKIYRSTNLVHWEVIAQPVLADWPVYDDRPGRGAWGGHMVLYNGQYWHYFGRGGGHMYFVTADDPTGSWSAPTQVQIPPGVGSLGVDNSIFIDEDSGKWYMLTKAGHSNNHIVELGYDGQPTGVVLDLRWLNPDEDGLPYGWAEGPVMWKYNGYYYYSFAEHLVGQQYVMKADTLSDNPNDWEIMEGNMYWGSRGTYNRPNHISPVVMLDDSTSWAIGHSYHQSGDWYAQGRQGLLHRVIYTDDGWPLIQYPSDLPEEAPNLPSRGIPWMVPKSDNFNAPDLTPEWSLLGYKSSDSYSLAERPGWLYLIPFGGRNTVIQNDGEHQYSLVTRVDFEPESTADEAGLWIFNGPETHYVKVYSTANPSGESVLAFSFQDTYYEVNNTVGPIVWLRLVRDNHTMTGYYSSDGNIWTRIGEPINALAMGREQSQFNDFTGNQQGLYVKGKPAFFDLYIYRDAFWNIAAQYPANRSGVRPFSNYLGDISNDGWALYAGVEFSRETSAPNENENPLPANFVRINASSATSGGVVEVWLDSIGTGRLIAEVHIESTGNWNSYETFMADMEEVTGRHDVYLRFKGDGDDELFRLDWLRFSVDETDDFIIIVPPDETGLLANQAKPFTLEQNYPNPFSTYTSIQFNLLSDSEVSLRVYDLNGRLVATLIDGAILPATSHTVPFNAASLTDGVYIYRIYTGGSAQSKRMVLIR